MPKTDASQERKSQIITAATAVFAKKGFYEARMDDIVQESGLSKGTLYWYFDSKDDIIFAILDSFFSKEMEGMEKITAADKPASEKLMILVQQLTADMQAMTIYQSIALEFYALANRREEIRLSLLDYFNYFQDGITHLIQQGIDSGEFRPVDPAIVAGILIAQLEGTALLWAFNPKGVNLETYTTTAVSLLLTGLSSNS